MPTILIADDEEMIRTLIREALSRADGRYRFLEAADGVAALQMAQERNPDLVLLDVVMPSLSGLQVCRALKEAEATRHVPIILMTARSDRALRVQAVEAGGDDFLFKPFDVLELTLRVKSLLRIKELHDALQERYAASREQNQELQELGRWREDLTHMLIHDMRNPLSNTQLALQFVLDEGAVLDPVHRRMLEVAFSSVVQLDRMVNNILDINRMERGRLILNKLPQDIPALIQQSIQQLAPLASVDDKRLMLAVDEVPPVKADGDLLSRIVANLLDNAIRYSPRGSLILVTLGKMTEGAGLRVSIHSPGEPIPAEAREAIFDKFRQLGNSQARGRGVGLGLAFCRMAVEAHGGSIWVESAEGVGNTFHFTLPAAFGGEQT